jgi:hypothetical protein
MGRSRLASEIGSYVAAALISNGASRKPRFAVRFVARFAMRKFVIHR